MDGFKIQYNCTYASKWVHAIIVNAIHNFLTVINGKVKQLMALIKLTMHLHFSLFCIFIFHICFSIASFVSKRHTYAKDTPSLSVYFFRSMRHAVIAISTTNSKDFARCFFYKYNIVMLHVLLRGNPLNKKTFFNCCFFFLVRRIERKWDVNTFT